MCAMGSNDLLPLAVQRVLTQEQIEQASKHPSFPKAMEEMEKMGGVFSFLKAVEKVRGRKGFNANEIREGFAKNPEDMVKRVNVATQLIEQMAFPMDCVDKAVSHPLFGEAVKEMEKMGGVSSFVKEAKDFRVRCHLTPNEFGEVLAENPKECVVRVKEAYAAHIRLKGR